VLDPGVNSVKGARISLTTAVGLAASLGLRVSGFEDDAGGNEEARAR
jgi:hypothetical protein